MIETLITIMFWLLVLMVIIFLASLLVIWVLKFGTALNVGVTEKGGAGNLFDYNASGTLTSVPCIDAQFHREGTWNAWLYAITTTLDETISFFNKIWFTTPSDLTVTGNPLALLGAFKTAEVTPIINGIATMFDQNNLISIIYEDDGTQHADVNAFAKVAATDYYVTNVYNQAIDDFTSKVYTVAGDTLKQTSNLTTTGWTWDVDMMGISAHKIAGNSFWNNPFEFTRFKINSGTTEEFVSNPVSNGGMSTIIDMMYGG